MRSEAETEQEPGTEGIHWPAEQSQHASLLQEEKENAEVILGNAIHHRKEKCPLTKLLEGGYGRLLVSSLTFLLQTT